MRGIFAEILFGIWLTYHVLGIWWIVFIFWICASFFQIRSYLWVGWCRSFTAETKTWFLLSSSSLPIPCGKWVNQMGLGKSLVPAPIQHSMHFSNICDFITSHKRKQRNRIDGGRIVLPNSFSIYVCPPSNELVCKKKKELVWHMYMTISVVIFGHLGNQRVNYIIYKSAHILYIGPRKCVTMT